MTLDPKVSSAALVNSKQIASCKSKHRIYFTYFKGNFQLKKKKGMQLTTR